MATSIPIAVRSSAGINLTLGPPSYQTLQTSFTPVLSTSCRTMLFSPDGKYLAYAYGDFLSIVQTYTWEKITFIRMKAYHLAFSPKSTYLMSWEPFTVGKDNPQGAPNLNIYRTVNGELVKNFIHKKQTNWEPIWSSDEHLFSRIVNSDVVFYEDANFEKIVFRINSYKVASYSLSPIVGTYYVLCNTPGGQGQPSVSRLFKYPNFDTQQSLADKSFFQANKVEFYWNPKGNSALLMTMTEVDKTGGSYYGKQGLHFMDVNGQTAMVVLGKEGPIYSVAWSPKSQEFCVIYGFTPAKATLYNLKCEPIFELGTGPRNSIYYNPQGNILLLGGFGNLRGQIETWDINNRKLIGNCEAPDTTYLEWSPDGTHFLTATTAPRLRIDNGYKIWHYSGTLLFEKPWAEQEELYEICWQKYPKGIFKESAITSEKIEGIASTVPQASKQVYRPPSARNRPTVNFKLHDEEEQPHKPGGDTTPSKAALKQKKKREARKARKTEGGDEESDTKKLVSSSVQIILTGDPEKDKKIKNIKKKLDAIEKLKEQQVEGKPLEINQLSKIKAEADLIKELQQLQV